MLESAGLETRADASPAGAKDLPVQEREHLLPIVARMSEATSGLFAREAPHVALLMRATCYAPIPKFTGKQFGGLMRLQPL